MRVPEPSSAATGRVEADAPWPDGTGAYVHVPFCTRRCDYCAFATWSDRDRQKDAYVDAVLTEVGSARDREGLRPAATVFVGGGTPSALGGERLERIVSSLEHLPDAEVTVECNPETTTAPLLTALVTAGVTRVSLGAQSMDREVLAGLGRHQDPDDVRKAAGLLGEAGVASYNVDLIYGGAGETDASWAATVAAVLGLDPPPTHVSAYALTVEPGTPLAADPSRHPDEDVQARRYAIADEILEGAGLAWYEVSNWAVPGHECRHNLGYWSQGAYRGFGPSAHSHRAGRRFWNVRNLDRYLAAVAARNDAVAGEERLGEAEQALEALQLSLRTRYGVPLSAFPPDDLACLEDAGPLGPLVERRAERAVLTRRGRLLCNEVALALRPPPS